MGNGGKKKGVLTSLDQLPAAVAAGELVLVETDEERRAAGMLPDPLPASVKLDRRGRARTAKGFIATQAVWELWDAEQAKAKISPSAPEPEQPPAPREVAVVDRVHQLLVASNAGLADDADRDELLRLQQQLSDEELMTLLPLIPGFTPTRECAETGEEFKTFVTAGAVKGVLDGRISLLEIRWPAFSPAGLKLRDQRRKAEVEAAKTPRPKPDPTTPTTPPPPPPAAESPITEDKAEQETVEVSEPEQVSGPDTQEFDLTETGEAESEQQPEPIPAAEPPLTLSDGETIEELIEFLKASTERTRRLIRSS